MNIDTMNPIFSSHTIQCTMFVRGITILTSCLLPTRTTAKRLPKNYSSNLQLAQDILDELFLTSLNTKVESAPAPVAKQAEEEAANLDKPKADLQTGPSAQQTLASSTSNIDPNLHYDGNIIIDWINNNGGYIHPSARIGLDPTGQYRGVFVKTPEEGGTEGGIEDEEVICKIPWSLLIKPPNYAWNRYFSCESMQELYKEFQLGDESSYAPYINYLMNQPRGRLISEWTTQGKQFLSEMLNKKWDEDDNEWVGGLPPKFAKSYEEVWLEWCKGEDTPLAKAAFYQFTSRDEDTLMVPFWDMHNHSNDPKKLNTIHHKPKRAGLPFILTSTRKIEPGEQIFISYTRCNRCWHDEQYEDCTTFSHYSSSDVFDVFGFVEDFPQTWAFGIETNDPNDEWDEVVFCLEHDEESGNLLVSFGDNYSDNPEEWIPTDGGLEFLHRELSRLNAFEKEFKEDKELIASIPQYEWETAWRYHDALMTALSAAIIAADAGSPQGIVHQEPLVDDDSGDSGDEAEEDSSDDSGDEDELVSSLAPGSDEL